MLSSHWVQSSLSYNSSISRQSLYVPVPCSKIWGQHLGQPRHLEILFENPEDTGCTQISLCSNPFKCLKPVDRATCTIWMWSPSLTDLGLLDGHASTIRGGACTRARPSSLCVCEPKDSVKAEHRTPETSAQHASLLCLSSQPHTTAATSFAHFRDH